MGKIIIDLNNVHRDEQTELKERLENQNWNFKELTNYEILGVLQCLNYIVTNDITRATDLNIDELKEVKEKFKNIFG